VPYRLRKAFRKIHVRLVRELEKKFSGKVRHLRALLCFELALSCILVCCGSTEQLWVEDVCWVQLPESSIAILGRECSF
jgi:hypothetical protein